jgi:hypothetical protein
MKVRLRSSVSKIECYLRRRILRGSYAQDGAISGFEVGLCLLHSSVTAWDSRTFL